jgi:predicted dehydrogenase
MEKAKTVRMGVIGVGSMGASHARAILEGKIPGMELAAVADVEASRTAAFPTVERFTSCSELIQNGAVDAVLIATPHYSHLPLGIEALEKGLHVLVEKPISVHKADCERLIEAWRNPKQVFAAMFNQRTDPTYRKLKDLIVAGELGEIRRMSWTVTDWYRTDYYYRTGDWRATWGGEGGGVLLNQCPHNLDLLQWLFGMPVKVQANCQFGRFHDIEVEDAVTALLEFPDGATAVFTPTTGEAPGTNRREVAADRGKVVIEAGKLSFTRTEQSVTEHCRTAQSGFEKPPVWDVSIPLAGKGEQHIGILKNFTAAILEDVPLIAPAPEGIHSVELANAMLFSGFTGKAVEIPMDGAAYEKVLKDKIAHSTYEKPASVSDEVADLSNSF